MNGLERIEQAAKAHGWKPNHANDTPAMPPTKRVYYGMRDTRNGIRLTVFVGKSGSIESAVSAVAIDGALSGDNPIQLPRNKAAQVADYIGAHPVPAGATAAAMAQDPRYQRRLAALREQGVIQA